MGLSHTVTHNHGWSGRTRIGFYFRGRDYQYTLKGPVRYEGTVNPFVLQGYSFDKELNVFRPALRQKQAMVNIASTADGKVFIAHNYRKVIGYVTFCTPDKYQRWTLNDSSRLLELGAIEVSPNWRQERVGMSLLDKVFSDGRMEDYIIISQEYCWHWDLLRTGLGVWEYQRMLHKVLSAYGFTRWSTDDPDIICHPANMFMVRVGSRVPADVVIELQNQCFKDKWMI